MDNHIIGFCHWSYSCWRKDLDGFGLWFIESQKVWVYRGEKRWSVDACPYFCCVFSLSFFTTFFLSFFNPLVAWPVPLPRVVAPLPILGQNSLVLFLPLTLSDLPEWIRIGGSLSTYLYGMHIRWSKPFACLFWAKCHPNKAFSPEKASVGTPK